MENRVGRLHNLMRRLERDDLRIIALSIDDSVDCAVVRLMFDHFERARELLQLGGYSFIESDIIGVELPEAPQPFLAVCSTLLQSEINIHYTYPLLYRRGGHAGIALYVDDLENIYAQIGDDASLANIDLQNAMQKLQQIIFI